MSMSVQHVTTKFAEDYPQPFFESAIKELFLDETPDYSEYFSHDHHTLCAEKAGKIVGAVVVLFSKENADAITKKSCLSFPHRVGKNWDGTSWLVIFTHVHRGHRKQGIASELFDRWAEEAKHSGVAQVQFFSDSVDQEEQALKGSLFSQSLKRNKWIQIQEKPIPSERFPHTTLVTIKPETAV